MEKTPKKPIKLRMNVDFESFDKKRKESFLEDLSRLSGVPREEITKISFRQGCVIFEASLDREAAERLAELFLHRNDTQNSEELVALRAFVKKYGVHSLTDDLSYRIQIVTSRKAAEITHVVFVHGWRGDELSFGKMPELLNAVSGLESLVYPYPTGVWKSSPSIQYIARNLENWIRNRVRGNGKLALIAHSMGGVISRQFIVSQIWRDRPISKAIKLITLIASPHHGMALADIARLLPAVSDEQLRDLSPNSPFLVELNQQWAKWSSQNVPESCRVRCIYGTKDKVVPTASASALDSEAVPMLNATHRGIVKIGSREDEVLVTFTRFLEEAGLLKQRLLEQ